jgi:nucleoside-triphosphatase THEP1
MSKLNAITSVKGNLKKLLGASPYASVKSIMKEGLTRKQAEQWLLDNYNEIVDTVKENVKDIKKKEKKAKPVQRKEIAYEHTIVINDNTIEKIDWRINDIELNTMKRRMKNIKTPLLYQQKIEFYDKNGNKMREFKYTNQDGEKIKIYPQTFETDKITKEFIQSIEMYLTIGGGSAGGWIPMYIMEKNGYTKIITRALKHIEPKANKQIYKDANTGSCVYDGCVKYFETKKDTNKNAKAIYNKLIKNKEEYAKGYTEEEIANELAPVCKSSISIQDLITTKNKTFNENSNNRFHLEFMNTKYNHLDLIAHTYDESVTVNKIEYDNIKNENNFWIERYGKLITLDNVYVKEKDDFNYVYNIWKDTTNYNERFIYQDSKEYDFITKTYDYKLHTFFNKMPIDNDLYTEIDLKKAYLNYSDCEFNKYYSGVPTGSFINVKCDENFDFQQLLDNFLVGFFQVQFLENDLDERLGFTEGSIHTLYTSMIELLHKNGVKFIFLNACYSPSCHMPFTSKLGSAIIEEKNIIKNITMKDKDENGLKHYCKAFGLMLSENSTIDMKIKPLKCDIKYFNTFEKNDDVFLFKDDGIVKVQYKNKKAKSFIHIGYAIHAYTQTLILEQLLKMDLDEVFGVKLDSIVITKNYSEDLKKQYKGIYDNYRFDEKECKIEGMLNDDEEEVCNEGEEVSIGFYRKYIVSRSDEYTNFDLSFIQTGECIYNRVVFIGGKGGSGKTTSLMNSLNKNCYTTMCWNLIQNKINFVGHSIPQLIGSNVTDDENEKTKFTCEITQDKSFKYLIVDEATLIHKASIKKIIETYKDIFIFILGDIDYDGRFYQSSIHKTLFNPSEEDCQYIQYTKSYRFDDNLNNKLNGLRENMKLYNSSGYNYVKKHFANCFFKKEDIIMNDNDVGISALDDLKRGNEWTEYFVNKGTKPKYFIKKTNANNGQMRGQELEEQPDHSNYEMKLFKTIHSFQGLDLNQDNKIIIILNSLFDKNLLYTALSRARREDQIIIIDEIKTNNSCNCGNTCESFYKKCKQCFESSV